MKDIDTGRKFTKEEKEEFWTEEAEVFSEELERLLKGAPETQEIVLLFLEQMGRMAIVSNTFTNLVLKKFGLVIDSRGYVRKIP